MAHYSFERTHPCYRVGGSTPAPALLDGFNLARCPLLVAQTAEVAAA